MDLDNEIDAKILRVLNGKASDAERREVDNWIGESKSNSFQFKQLKDFWNESTFDPRLIGQEGQKKRIWNAFLAENNTGTPLPVLPVYRKIWFKIAVIMVIMLVPVYILLNHEEETMEEETQEIKVISKANPTGQKSLIQLPDGSKVWLNSDSRISYQESFSDSLRSLKLEGEAYFDVVPDSRRPFVVAFETLSVTVLGTEFNISAFNEEKDVRVTLVDGSVKISALDRELDEKLILSPGTGIIFSKDKRDYHEFSRHSNPDLFHRATEWRNGTLLFNGKDFDGFVREIKRWYGVQVIVEGRPPRGWSIRATFENELLTNVMDAISYNKGFRYSLKDKELKIMFN